MKKVLLILIALIISSTIFAQVSEAVGAGVINFLLSSPSTANQMSGDQQIALNIVGGLLDRVSRGKSEMNLASASATRTEINLTSQSDGRQATLVLDAEGNVYVLSGGMIVPLSKNFVEEARQAFVPKNSFENQFIPPYDLKELEKSFVFSEDASPSKYIEYTILNPSGEYMSNIAKKHNTSPWNIEIIYWRGKETRKTIKKMRSDERVVKKGTILKLFIPKTKLTEELNFLFTCMWARDLDEDGYDFQDFNGIKNSFSTSGKITFVAGYQLTHEGCQYYITIYEHASGNKVCDLNGKAPSGKNILIQEITSSGMSLGRYVYNIKIKKSEEKIISKSGEFEIVNHK